MPFNTTDHAAVYSKKIMPVFTQNIGRATNWLLKLNCSRLLSNERFEFLNSSSQNWFTHNTGAITMCHLPILHFNPYLFGSRQGEEWRKIRVMLNGKLVKPAHAQKYLNKLSTISEDLTDKIQVIRDQEDKDKTVPNILSLLYAWSIECKFT